MYPPRVSDGTYIDFLIGMPKVASACEAARVHPHTPAAPAHDAFSRLLARLEPDPETLWKEVQPHVRRGDSVLIVDDTVLDKPYAHKMGLVGQVWSGKRRRVVRGINLVTLAWSDGDAVYPTDYRLVDPAEAPKKNKNEHFREMLVTAKARGFSPRYVCFDAWFSSKDNLKAVRTHGWHFLTQVRSHRNVDRDRTGNNPIAQQLIAATGTIVQVEGLGPVKAFRIVAPNGDTEHWITNDLTMDELARLTYAQLAWNIEEYHWALKQFTEVERCPARLAASVIGTVIAIVLCIWRQARTEASIVQGIEKGIADSLKQIPDADARRLINEDVEQNCVGRKEAITKNISVTTASLQMSLDEAIHDVEKGNVTRDEEGSRLGELRDRVRAELTVLESTARRYLFAPTAKETRMDPGRGITPGQSA